MTGTNGVAIDENEKEYLINNMKILVKKYSPNLFLLPGTALTQKISPYNEEFLKNKKDLHTKLSNEKKVLEIDMKENEKVYNLILNNENLKKKFIQGETKLAFLRNTALFFYPNPN